MAGSGGRGAVWVPKCCIEDAVCGYVDTLRLRGCLDALTPVIKKNECNIEEAQSNEKAIPEFIAEHFFLTK